MSEPAEIHAAISDQIDRVVVGNEDVVERLTVAALTGGHVLVEGVPGVAKTTMANAFARAFGLDYHRVQMTPDILPADIVGTHVYREQRGEFELKRGPVFSNILLADEINRATPKTQSALLEAMQEGQATIEGETLDLPEPFMVVATQNPIEMEGVFSLPEAQRDRFQFKLVVDIPDRDDERKLLDEFDADPTLDSDSVRQVVSPTDLFEARETVADVYVDEKVREYILDVVEATRNSPALAYGASPRASLVFLNAGKALAAVRGRDYVIPDDIKQLSLDVLRHRLVLSTEADLSDRSVDDTVRDLLEGVTVPDSGGVADGAPARVPGGSAESASEWDWAGDDPDPDPESDGSR